MSDKVPDERATKPLSAAEEAELHARRAALDSKLEKHRPTVVNSAGNEPQRGNKAGIGLAFRLSSEFIAGIVVGTAFGYSIDIFFGTAPWGMIIFLMLGFAAAVLNVLRASGMVAESQLHLHKDHSSDDNDAPKN